MPRKTWIILICPDCLGRWPRFVGERGQSDCPSCERPGVRESVWRAKGKRERAKA